MSHYQWHKQQQDTETKDKVFTVYAMKAYRGKRGIALPILNLSSLDI